MFEIICRSFHQKAQQKIWDKYVNDFNFLHFIGDPYSSEREVDYVSAQNDKYLVLNTNDGYPNLAKKLFLHLSGQFLI